MKPLRIVAAVVGAMIGSFAVKAALSKGGVSVEDLKKYTTAGIVAELPGPPQPLEVPLPAEIRSKVVSMENFQVEKGNFLAALTRVVYTPDVEASLDGALKGALANAMSSQNMTKLSENRQPTTVSGVGGIR